MFKHLSTSSISTRTPPKSSLIRSLRNSHPEIGDELFSKKRKIEIVKCKENISLITIDGIPMFANSFDGEWIPMLRTLHLYPNLLPTIQVDKGAIKFVLSGANIMCRGLTSKGAQLDPQLPIGKIVAVKAEGKEHILAIGEMKMTGEDIIKINKDVGVDTLHYLGDPLWKLEKIE